MPVVIPPAGLSAASFFVPGVQVVDPTVPPGILADDLDPLTGELLGLFDAPNVVDAAVRWAFSVRNGSGGAVLDQGHRFHEIKKKTAGVDRALVDESSRVLKPFIDAKLVELVAVSVDSAAVNVGFDGASQVLKYRNRLTDAAVSP